MIITGHLLIGGAIGATATALLPSPSPWTVLLSLGLGILSHHVLDMVPHTDAATFCPDPRKVPWHVALIVAVEVLTGIVLTSTLFVTQHTTWAFVAGAVGGVLPDLLDEIPLWQERFQKSALGGIWHRWHYRLHCNDMYPRWQMGLAVDVIVVGGGLLFLLNIG